MTSQLYYQKGILYERARVHSWSGVRGQAKKHVIPCCCFSGEEIHFKVHIFIFTKKGHLNMLHNNMHILTVLQSKSFKPVFNLSMKKRSFFLTGNCTGIVHVARQHTYTMIAALIKGSASELQNYFCLEEHLYIFVHKRLSPTVKKVNKRFIPPTDS